MKFRKNLAHKAKFFMMAASFCYFLPLIPSLFFLSVFIERTLAPPPSANAAPSDSHFQLSAPGAGGAAADLFGGGALANIAINSLDPCKYFENITGILFIFICLLCG